MIIGIRKTMEFFKQYGVLFFTWLGALVIVAAGAWVTSLAAAQTATHNTDPASHLTANKELTAVFANSIIANRQSTEQNRREIEANRLTDARLDAIQKGVLKTLAEHEARNEQRASRIEDKLDSLTTLIIERLPNGN